MNQEEHDKVEKMLRCSDRERRINALVARRLKLREVDGDKVRICDELCDCGRSGEHHKIVVRRNGKDISEPLCPVVAGLRKMRLKMERGEVLEPDAISKLLAESKCQKRKRPVPVGESSR